MQAEWVHITQLIPDPQNPRTDFTPEKKAALAASLKSHGVKTPLIGYRAAGGVMIGDGHCRWEAAQAVGLTELPVVVFPERPSEAELLATQLTINTHRQNLNPLDELAAFTRLARLKGWQSPSELATGLSIHPSEVTRVLSLGKLTPEEQALVRQGKLSKSAAYALTRAPAEERAELARQAAAGGLSRDRLNAKARRSKPAETAKTQRIRCELPGGKLSVQSAAGLNLAGLIDLLDELLRECRKARTQGLDISTAMRVLHDRSRASPAG